MRERSWWQWPPGVGTHQWLHGALLNSVGRNICTTAGGRLGTVSCIFLGGDIPFVLRLIADGYFKLVGEMRCRWNDAR